MPQLEVAKNVKAMKIGKERTKPSIVRHVLINGVSP